MCVLIIYWENKNMKKSKLLKKIKALGKLYSGLHGISKSQDSEITKLRSKIAVLESAQSGCRHFRNAIDEITAEQFEEILKIKEQIALIFTKLQSMPTPVHETETENIQITIPY